MTQPKLNCIHHWNVNQQNIGTCVKCGEIRNFAAIAEKKRSDAAKAKSAAAIERRKVNNSYWE